MVIPRLPPPLQRSTHSGRGSGSAGTVTGPRERGQSGWTSPAPSSLHAYSGFHGHFRSRRQPRPRPPVRESARTRRTTTPRMPHELDSISQRPRPQCETASRGRAVREPAGRCQTTQVEVGVRGAADSRARVTGLLLRNRHLHTQVILKSKQAFRDALRTLTVWSRTPFGVACLCQF